MLQSTLVVALLFVTFLRFNPVLELEILLGQFVKQVFVHQDNVFGLNEVFFELVVLEVPAIRGPFSLANFIFHL